MKRDDATGAVFGTFALVLISIAGLFAIDTFLARVEQRETSAEAKRLFDEGLRLEQEHRYADAIERFRSAVSISRDNTAYQLSLADALMRAGRFSDAELIASAVLQRNPADGWANLLMARIQERKGDTVDAITYFHQAVYGQWSDNAEQHQREARMELIDLLATHNDQKDLLAELLPLEDEMGNEDVAAQERVARLFLQAGSPRHAADVFRRLLATNPDNARLYAGLADAEFDQNNYRGAATDYRTALRLQPGDPEIRKRLNVVEGVLELDPTRRDVSAHERYLRSVELLQRALNSVEQCPEAFAAAGDAVQRAEKALKRRWKASEEGNLKDADLDLAEQLWRIRKNNCKQPVTDAEEPLRLILARMSQ